METTMFDFNDSSRSPRISTREAAPTPRARNTGTVRRDFIFEQYLSRLPVPLLFVSAAGELLFATPEGRRELERWNRALPQAATLTEQSLLPANIDRLLDGATKFRSRKREPVVSWSVRHPKLQNLHLQMDECHGTRDDGGLAGYWVTFLDHEPEDADAAPSANALTLLQGLSPSERKVALLVSRGLTNGQVAASIVRSVRTVEFQLHSIYKKLGVKGRTQLALALN